MLQCEGGSCEKFRMVVNPKPDKYNLILSHGALTCKKCSVLWNRDENSARNIYKISYNAIDKLERQERGQSPLSYCPLRGRPEYLSRSKNFSDTTSIGKKSLSTYRETV